jgi:hypothetical protein
MESSDAPGVDVPDLPLLLRLRLQGSCPAHTDAAHLLATGFAVERRGMLILTAAGRTAADERYRFADGSPQIRRLGTAFDRFSALNQGVIRACSDWQAEGGWKVVDRLSALDDKVGPVLRTLGEQVPRYARYRPLLRHARTRIEQGDGDWFVAPTIDSYHTVWMQLHEDMLVGLGRDRSDEA